MDHDDDVRLLIEGEAVTGFLVSAVACVVFVGEHRRVRERLGDGGGFIRAGVVHKDDVIHDLLRHYFIVGFADGLGSIVRRHHDDDFLISKHAASDLRAKRLERRIAWT